MVATYLPHRLFGTTAGRNFALLSMLCHPNLQKVLAHTQVRDPCESAAAIFWHAMRPHPGPAEVSSFLFIMWCDFTGIADTPCRRSPFAQNFSEVIFSSAWVWSSELPTSSELFRFLGSPPAFSVCLNAHLSPSQQFPLK